MGLFAKLMIALLVIGGLAPFTFLKGKDGQPLMSFSDIKGPKLPDISLPDMNSDEQASEAAPVKSDGTIYKWKDKSGTWQFTSEPPPEGKEFSASQYDNNVNVIQSVPTKRSEAKKAQIEKQQSSPQSVSDLGNVYAPEKVEKLFKDANNLETLLNDRMKEQKKVLDNL